MRCPNCSSDVSPAPFCSNCGAPLPANPFLDSLTAPAPAAIAQAGMPLTFGQRARLIVDCLPLLFFVLAFAFVATLLDDIVGAPPPPLLLPLLGVVILVTGYQAFQRVRDLISGAALVRDDTLERSWRSRQRGSRCYGNFTQLGRLQMSPRSFVQAQNGQRHRVVYSPASKIAWSVEPLQS